MCSFAAFAPNQVCNTTRDMVHREPLHPRWAPQFGVTFAGGKVSTPKPGQNENTHFQGLALVQMLRIDTLMSQDRLLSLFGSPRTLKLAIGSSYLGVRQTVCKGPTPTTTPSTFLTQTNSRSQGCNTASPGNTGYVCHTCSSFGTQINSNAPHPGAIPVLCGASSAQRQSHHSTNSAQAIESVHYSYKGP
jgi:hypothetical protein